MTKVVKYISTIASVIGMWMVLGSGISHARVNQLDIPTANSSATGFSHKIRPNQAKAKKSPRSITMRRGARVGYVQELVISCPSRQGSKGFTTILRYSLIEKTVCSRENRCFSGVRNAAVAACRAVGAQSSTLRLP